MATAVEIDPSLTAVGIGGYYDGTLEESGALLAAGLELTGATGTPNVAILGTAASGGAYYDSFMVGLSRAYMELGLGQANVRGVHPSLLDDTHPSLPKPEKNGVWPSADELEERLHWADVVYVLGGNPRFMLEKWHEHGIMDALKDIMPNVVLTGHSAGLIWPYSYMHSDYQSYEKNSGWKYEVIEGSGLVKAIAVPHWDSYTTSETGEQGPPREENFASIIGDSIVPEEQRFGFGVDNNAALIVHDGKIQAIQASLDLDYRQGVHLIDARTGNLVTSQLPAHEAPVSPEF